jgi:hypothetical protein
MAKNIKEEVEVVVPNSDWESEYNKQKETNGKEYPPIFEMKLNDGQIARTEEIEFLDEGKKETTKFGDCIIFQIKNHEVAKTWFIKTNLFSLLNPIAKQKKLGALKGRNAEVTRAGAKKETRWAIKFD